ncbi:unnamed protein product [Miscanthus lutarioriparius]|uniref:FACT complex subunit SSRP1/POB3 N-terminal PH domain-containing protein n=1 Tax=Miscanthus lutarioriparius TaxID=422564 RepID=A0A811S9W3_9POAL|nr:unnamed protein product [Miscanthus lutarioriparius]
MTLVTTHLAITGRSRSLVLRIFALHLFYFTLYMMIHERQLNYSFYSTFSITTTNLRKLLLVYVGIPRYEGPEVDPTIVTHDAKDLYKAGEKRLGTDEKTFIRVFTERSWAHLASVSSAYHHMYDRKLDKVIKSETSGNFEFALLTILDARKPQQSILLRTLVPGQFKVYSGGLAWKRQGGGKTIEIDKADVTAITWMKVPRAYQLGVRIKDGLFYRFIGFREQVPPPTLRPCL